MAVQLSVTGRNAKLDALETYIGVSAKLYLRSGAPPANCAAADSGTLLASGTLPSDWMASAAAGIKAKAGTWQATGVAPGGTIGHFRIKDNGDTACHIQGTVTITGAGGDMTVDNTNIAESQVVTVQTFQWTEGNA